MLVLAFHQLDLGEAMDKDSFSRYADHLSATTECPTCR